MFKFHPLGCKIQLLEPDFVKACFLNNLLYLFFLNT